MMKKFFFSELIRSEYCKGVKLVKDYIKTQLLITKKHQEAFIMNRQNKLFSWINPL